MKDLKENTDIINTSVVADGPIIPDEMSKIFAMGKRPQTRGAAANPKSKHCISKVIKNRNKNKARKKFNARMRKRG